MKNKTESILFGALVVGILFLTDGCSTPTVTVGTPTRHNRCVLSITGSAGSTVLCTDRNGATEHDVGAVLPVQVVFDRTITRELEVKKRLINAVLVVEVRDPYARPIRFVARPGSTGVRLVRTTSTWQGEVF